MERQWRWHHAAVLGAVGKMGSGIALLLLQEIAFSPKAVLTLLDVNSDGFSELREYLRSHLTRFAERNIKSLRKLYADRADLIDNSEMIEEFVVHSLDRVRCVTSLEECRGAELIFEAIIEDIEIKSDVFRRVAQYADSQAFYFTNTSSIPIGTLVKNSNLNGRLIGFHFYNPPSVQKLLELIIPEGCNQELQSTALEIAKRLNKSTVISKDVAGFIGNGHFIREIVGACKHVRTLRSTLPSTEALYAVNRISQEFLLRPMGIFQLVDYVGIDVCQHIGSIMSQFLAPQVFTDGILETMLKAGIKGGQHPEGSQKPGFFQYENGRPVAIYDIQHKSYVPCKGETWEANFDDKIGIAPEGCISWKKLSKDNDRKDKIAQYFRHLWRERSLGAELAQVFLSESRAIAYGLVEDGVARSITDVDTVLQLGFYHLYGVDEPFMATQLGGEHS